jgi:tetratricopeptide (TPR) repeat protein
LEAALARAHDVPPSLRAAGHCFATLLNWTMGASDRALEHAEAALAFARAAGDTTHLAFALYFQSLVLAWDRGRWEAAIPLAEEAIVLARKAGPERVGWLPQIALGDLGTMVALQGDHTRGIEMIEEARAQHHALGHHFGVGIRTAELGLVEQLEGHVPRAAAHYAESLRQLRSSGDAMSVALPLAGLVGVTATSGLPRWAARVLGMLEAIRDRVGVASQHGPPAVWYPVREQGEHQARTALGPEAYTEAFEAACRLRRPYRRRSPWPRLSRPEPLAT